MKLQKIVRAAHYHFQKKEPLLFVVDNDISAKYIDDLLWKMPQESFLPHIVTSSPTKELIAISSKKKSLNGANHFFNLTNLPLLLEDFYVVYEFEDFTQPEKIKLAQFKYAQYRAKDFAIESQSTQ